MSEILDVVAREILDSREIRPLRSTCSCPPGTWAGQPCPPGASTGANEAIELRDGDPQEIQGQGHHQGGGQREQEGRTRLVGMDALDQVGIDELLLELDETPNKSASARTPPPACPWPWPRAGTPTSWACRCTATSAGPSPADPRTHDERHQRLATRTTTWTSRSS